MIQESLQRLQHYCDTIPSLVQTINENDLSDKPRPGKWSKKELIGHLIDSAANNHQRFIRAQYEAAPKIIYEQDEWVALNHYQQADGNNLINLWASYNRQLITLMQHMPQDNLKKICRAVSGKELTLEWLFNDYVWHMEHHLRQLVGAENVLASPPYMYE